LWDPATGERFALVSDKNNELHIQLDALESALIVFEPRKIDLPTYKFVSSPGSGKPLKANWKVNFKHINGSTFSRNMERLVDFSTSEDEAIRTFAGTVTYTTSIEKQDDIKFINLTNVNQAVTELYINDEPAGMRWYGNHNYNVENLVQSGSNKIEIVLTTRLANYCMSLKDNATAQAWAGRYKNPFPSGLTGVEIVNSSE